MRPFELLFLVVALATSLDLLLVRQRWPRSLSYLGGLALLLSAGHLGVEGYRWQMVPGYLFMFLVLLLWLRHLRQSERRSAPHRPLAIAGALLGVVLWILAMCVTSRRMPGSAPAWPPGGRPIPS